MNEKADRLLEMHAQALEKGSVELWDNALAIMVVQLLRDRESITKADLIAVARKIADDEDHRLTKGAYEECIRRLNE